MEPTCLFLQAMANQNIVTILGTY